MFDAFHLPDQTQGDVQWFWPSQITGATTGWQMWPKPAGFDFLNCYLISGGAGGAGGSSSASGGGGGGGSSGLSRYRYPLWRLPDALYILVGHGGPGGAGGINGNSGSNGTAGQLSYLAIWPNTTVQNLLGVSGAAAPGGGQGSTAGGTAGTIATLAGAPLSFWAIAATFLAGVGGSNGGNAISAGSNLAIGTAGMIMGGTGGGGAGAGELAGGNISALANTPFGASPGGIASAGPGGNGFDYGQYRGVIYGGTGGGGENSTPPAGNGGNCGTNAPGAGGGGGGQYASSSNPGGGRGGDGGPGLVLMICT